MSIFNTGGSWENSVTGKSFARESANTRKCERLVMVWGSGLLNFKVARKTIATHRKFGIVFVMFPHSSSLSQFPLVFKKLCILQQYENISYSFCAINYSIQGVSIHIVPSTKQFNAAFKFPWA